MTDHAASEAGRPGLSAGLMPHILLAKLRSSTTSYHCSSTVSKMLTTASYARLCIRLTACFPFGMNRAVPGCTRYGRCIRHSQHRSLRQHARCRGKRVSFILPKTHTARACHTRTPPHLFDFVCCAARLLTRWAHRRDAATATTTLTLKTMSTGVRFGSSCGLS